MLEYEKHTPKENWLVALVFDEGVFPFKVIRRESTRYEAFDLNDGNKLDANSADGTWRTPTDTEGRYFLEPQTEDHIYQIFTGITPTTGEVYLSYPKRVDRGSIISERSIPGNVGKWTGHDSPYNDPSPMTELWTVDDKYPYFKGANDGISNEAQKVSLNFFINMYSYKVIEDRMLAEDIIRGKRRATVHTLGDPEQPISIPAWMKRKYREFIINPEEVRM